MQPMKPDAVEFAQLTDEALLFRIARRDSRALAMLYGRHAQVIYNLIMRIVRESASADEILQDTFWQAWQKSGDFQAGNAAAWLYRIARNKSLDWLRRQKTRPQPVSNFDEPGMQPASTAAHTSIEQTIVRTWQQEHIRQALASLPAEQRQCLELAYFEGMSQRQIAEHMQTPVSTVKTRIQIALEKLERVMRAAGYRSGEGEL